MKNCRFLVTGGTGFIGSALVRRLHGLGHYVRILDSGLRSSVNRISDIIDDIDFYAEDIRDSGAVLEAIQGVDCVIHLAALNGTDFFYKKPSLVLDIGVRGMLNVIEGCQKQGVGNLVVASSSEVYQTPSKIPTDETIALDIPDILNPRYSYGGSKLISELLAINYGRSDFDRVTIFRPHNVYGPDMGMGHVIPQFILRALESLDKHSVGPVPFPIQGDGTQTRSFVHIDDMIDALMLVINKGKHLNIYHIGNPEEITIASVAEKLFEYLERDVHLETSPLPQGSTKRRCPNIDKIRELGFSPRIFFQEGLHSVVDWYISNRESSYQKN